MRLRLNQAQRILGAGMTGDNPLPREPQWNLVFPRGEWHGANLKPIGGSITLTDAVFDEMKANWEAAGKPQLPIYFNHPDDFAQSGVSPEELKKAAGWYVDFRKTDSGFEGLTEWTPNARARIDAREYAFISPEWTNKAADRRTGKPMGWWLYGAALLNDPFFNEQPRVAATAIAEPTHNPNKEKSMSFMKRIAAAFGMPEESTEEEITSKCEAMAKSTASATEETGKLTASLTAANDTTVKLTARVAELEAKDKQHADELFDRDFEAAMKAGLDEGRQGLPELRETLKATALVPSLGLVAAKKMIAALPKVKLEATGQSGDDKPGTDLEKFEALIAVKMKAGAKYTEASKMVAAENPDLAGKLFPSSTNTTRA